VSLLVWGLVEGRLLHLCRSVHCPLSAPPIAAAASSLRQFWGSGQFGGAGHRVSCVCLADILGCICLVVDGSCSCHVVIGSIVGMALWC
jgi:hypothetical protein